MDPINLLELDSSGVKVFLDSFDHVFSDCDGVVWSRDPLPGAGEFFATMKSLGKTVHFVSNNSLRSRENYERMFEAAGIKDGYENLTMPSIAIAEYLKSRNFDKAVYSITCPETENILKKNGFKCKCGPDLGPDYFAELHQFLQDDEEIGAVVFDSDYRINLPKMYKACTYLRRPDVLYINGATDRYIPLKPDLLAIGTGAFSDMVTEHTKRQPILLGKPGRQFGELAMKRAGVTDASRVLFIGDMIQQDVGLGKAAGFKTLLVLTNNTKEMMLAEETLRPDYYAPDLGSIVPVLRKVV